MTHIVTMCIGRLGAETVVESLRLQWANTRVTMSKDIMIRLVASRAETVGRIIDNWYIKPINSEVRVSHGTKKSLFRQ